MQQMWDLQTFGMQSSMYWENVNCKLGESICLENLASKAMSTGQ